MKYVPKMTDKMRDDLTNYQASGALLLMQLLGKAAIADLTSCEACLAEAEREVEIMKSLMQQVRREIHEQGHVSSGSWASMLHVEGLLRREGRDVSREPCDMLFKPCEPGMQDCVGFGHCRCQKELDRQTSLRQQLATLTQERDALKRIIDDTLREVPVGNVNAHIPENLPRDMEYYVQETVKQDFEIERLEKERDALREVTRALIRAGDALYVKGKFADPDYWAPCNWATVVEESAKLLTPSGEAGKGGGV